MPLWTVAWEPSDEVFAETFNVYARARGAAWRLHGSTAGLSLDITVPDVVDTFEAGIAPVTNGIEASEDEWAVVEFTPESLDDIAAPPSVASLTVEQVDQSFDVRARWPAVSDPHLSGYEIREGASWEFGLVRKFIPRGGDDDIETTLGLLAVKTTTFYVRALSTHGQYSAADASYEITPQTPNTYKAETPTDEHAGGYTGTKTNVEVASGNLQLEFAPALGQDWTDLGNTYTWPPMFPHLGSGTYVTAAMEAQDDAAAGLVADEVLEIDFGGTMVAPVTMYGEHWNTIPRPRFSDTAQTTATDIDARGVFDAIYGDETVVGGLGIVIEIRTTEDDPGGTPTWSGYRLFVPGARYRYRGVQIRLTLTSVWWPAWRFTSMTFRRHRRNLKDEVVVVDSTGSGGKAVTFAEPFTKTPVVSASAESATAAHVTVSDVTRTGCNVRVWNSSGSQITGTIHVVAAGV